MNASVTPSTALGGLRVAFVAFESFPNHKGSGVRISQMVNALAAAGATVRLITLSPSANHHPLGPGVEHTPVRLLEDNYLCRALAFRDACRHHLYDFAPDVVHFRGPFEGQAALSYAAARSAQTVFEVNGLPSVELRYHYPGVGRSQSFEGKLRALEQDVLRRVDHVLTQSRATRRFIELRTQGAATAIVIPNGADPSPAALAAAAPSSTVRLLYVGSISPWQGLHELLAALRQASKTCALSLTVIGPGRRGWRKQLVRWARRMKVDELLDLRDAVEQRVVARQVAECDVCVAPLVKDRRNRVQGCSPIKLFEYMAAGRAIVASDLPCVQEILTHRETALSPRPSNRHRLRDALVEIGGDPELRARLGGNAQRELLATGTWAHRRAALVQTYEGLIASRAVA